ncbi:MAG TPA: NAD(P)-dependent alcohol dehydrogenase [Gemmatimonadales bacterium]|nr:NAD(P)-dependent alcohol dehydrogenase [Gemmatimonadales bacterium]
MMKAIVQEGYGSPAVLHLTDIEVPAIGDDGVLVRIHAASVNALDWHTTRGMPYFIRALDGLRSPRNRIRGVDLAGRVEAVGPNVTALRPGDDVFGGTDGSFAEYTATTVDRLAVKPVGLSYAEAAALHVAGLTALQGLRDKANLQAGQRVLVNGAGGGVGTYAVQLAKVFGAHVTAVTRTESIEMVRSIGAHEVIDHTAEDFTRRSERYDVIFDIGGTKPLGHCRRVLARSGMLLVVGAPAGRWLEPAGRLLKAVALSPFVSQRLVPFISHNDREGLAQLGGLAGRGQIRSVIDREYPLAEAANAIAHVGTGRARGKVVVKVQ